MGSASTFLVVAMTCAACFVSAGPVAAERVSVNMEDESLTGVILLIAQEKGYFKELGLDVEFRKLVRAGPTIKLQALAGGSLDVARTHIYAGFVEDASRAGVRLVADGGRWVKDQPRESYMIVRKDLAAATRGYKDLRGLAVALPMNPGTYLGLEIRRGLAEAGLSERDLSLRDVRVRMRAALLASKRIDMAVMAEPSARQCIKRGIGAVFAGTDISPSSEQAIGLFFSPRFMERREVAERFLAGYLRGLEAYRTLPADESRRILERTLGVSLDRRQLEAVRFGPDGSADMDSLSRLTAEWLRLGMVKSAISLDEIYDPSFLLGARRILAARAAQTIRKGGR